WTRLRDVQESAVLKKDADDRAARTAADKQRRPDAERQAGPGSVTNTAKDRIDATKDRIAGAAKLKSDREKGNAAVARDVQESAVPTDKLVTFASDHAFRSALRKPQLTAKEKALLKALN